MSVRRTPLLDLRADEAVVRIGRGHLDAAARALNRLRSPRDAKSLHAFRVPIRRLRSLLRAYRPWLGKVAGRKVRRRMRELTRATNTARDTDVQIDWLRPLRPELAKDERPGFDWLFRRLAARRRSAYQAATARLRREFTDIRRLVRKRMADGGSKNSAPYRTAFLELLEPSVAELRQRLGVITGPNDEQHIHRARIQVKRVRYLIEPLGKEVADVHDALRPLKKLQKILGELHDVQVLDAELAAALEEAATEKARRLHRLALRGGGKKALSQAGHLDEAPGLVALAARARERRNALFGKLRRDWLDSRQPVLAAEFGVLCAFLLGGCRLRPRPTD